jgi:flavin-binding protein dodecin
MSKAFKLIEVVGVSTESYEEAVKNAVSLAQRTLTGVSWFEVVDFRGSVQGEEIEYQATVKMGFRLMDACRAGLEATEDLQVTIPQAVRSARVCTFR